MRSPASPDTDGSRLEIEDHLLLAAVLLLPWAFGGVEIWAFRSAALLLAAAGASALVKSGWDGLGFGESRPLWIAPAFLLAGWALCQIVPLPPSVVATVSPEAHAIYAEAFPAYDGDDAAHGVEAIEGRALELVPEAEGQPLPEGPDGAIALATPDCLGTSWRSVSVEPSATVERLAWYFALLIGFLAIRRRVSNRRRRGIYLGALLADCTALALFAVVQAESWNGKIFWLRTLLVDAQPFGPYVNPNHFAGVMELAVPALAGVAWARLRQSGRGAIYEARFTVATVAAALCAAAGIAASSKIAALLLAASVVGLGIVGARSLRTRWIVIGASVVLLTIGSGLLVGTRLGGRVASWVEGSDTSYLLEGREAVWWAGGRMAADFPIVGSGYGTFGEVFERYTPPGADARFAQAHNDYLEVLLEGGFVGFALLSWLIVAYARRVRARIARLGVSPRVEALGILAGVLSLAIHAFFDFNHQMPANALLFVAFCAVLVPARAIDGGVEEPA